MKKRTAIERLKLFNEKIDLINEFTFAKEMAEKQVGAIAEFQRGKGWESIYVGPNEESIHAVVNTLRLFIQNNDQLSLKNMDDFYSKLPISKNTINEFQEQREKINIFLDSNSNWSIEENNSLTYREIVSIFIYGHYSHTENKKQKTVKGLSTTAFFPLIQRDFVLILKMLINFLSSIKAVNDTALTELGG